MQPIKKLHLSFNPQRSVVNFFNTFLDEEEKRKDTSKYTQQKRLSTEWQAPPKSVIGQLKFV